MGQVIYVANTRLPSRRASANQIISMCNSFAANGHEITLLYPRRKQTHLDAPCVPVEDYFNLNDGVSLYQIPCLDGVQFAHRPLVPHWLAMFLFYIQGFTFAIAVLAYLRRLEFDIVFARAKAATILGAFQYGDRWFYASHRQPSRIIRLASGAFDRIGGVVVNTDGLAEVWRELTTAPVHIAQNGVDIERFEVEDTKLELLAETGLKIPPERNIACYTGSLKSWKGVDTLVQAAAHLPDVTILVVGGTTRQRTALNDRCAPIPDNVVFVDHVPPSDVPSYTALSDVLVLPNTKQESISEQYTSPLKLFEYMGASRPIVASDLASLRETLNDSTAHFVPPDDPSALAAGIQEVLADPAYAGELSDAARTEVRKYTWERRAERIAEFSGLEL